MHDLPLMQGEYHSHSWQLQDGLSISTGDATEKTQMPYLLE